MSSTDGCCSRHASSVARSACSSQGAGTWGSWGSGSGWDWTAISGATEVCRAVYLYSSSLAAAILRWLCCLELRSDACFDSGAAAGGAVEDSCRCAGTAAVPPWVRPSTRPPDPARSDRRAVRARAGRPAPARGRYGSRAPVPPRARAGAPPGGPACAGWACGRPAGRPGPSGPVMSAPGEPLPGDVVHLGIRRPGPATARRGAAAPRTRRLRPGDVVEAGVGLGLVVEAAHPLQDVFAAGALVRRHRCGVGGLREQGHRGEGGGRESGVAHTGKAEAS